MSSLGVSSWLINCFKSYHTSRSYRINIQNKYSSIAEIDCQVPQGSTLVPLLFLLYVDDRNQDVDCKLFLHGK